MQGTDPKLIDALNNATGSELFQLSTIIDRLVAGPRRIIAVREHEPGADRALPGLAP